MVTYLTILECFTEDGNTESCRLESSGSAKVKEILKAAAQNLDDDRLKLKFFIEQRLKHPGGLNNQTASYIASQNEHVYLPIGESLKFLYSRLYIRTYEQ